MLEGWQSTRLGSVIELKRGYDLPFHARQPGSVPVVSSSGPSGFHASAMVRAPGVVTGRYGTLGQVFFVDEDFWPLNTTLYVRDFKGNDPLYVSYLLRTIDFYSCSDKAAVPGVNRNHIHELTVVVPRPIEQRAIASILGALDDKIDLNRRMNETLEELARTIFKSWFVDFDPVRAKAAGRQPVGMDAETAALFPSRFVESERGEIPDTWQIGPLRDVFSLSYGKALPEARRFPGKVPVYGSGGIGGFHSVALVDGPGVVVGRKGSVGTVYWEPGPFFPIDTTFFVETDSIARLLWTFHTLKVIDIKRLGADSAVPGVNRTALLGQERPVPPTTIMERFSSQVTPWMQRGTHASAESHTLSNLRDLLLPKLISGELRVPTAEKMVEAAL